LAIRVADVYLSFHDERHHFRGLRQFCIPCASAFGGAGDGDRTVHRHDAVGPRAIAGTLSSIAMRRDAFLQLTFWSERLFGPGRGSVERR
jgi:hypothetical protein